MFLLAKQSSARKNWNCCNFYMGNITCFEKYSSSLLDIIDIFHTSDDDLVGFEVFDEGVATRWVELGEDVV